MTDIELLKGLDTEIGMGAAEQAERKGLHKYMAEDRRACRRRLHRKGNAQLVLSRAPSSQRQPSLRYLACNVYGPAAVSGSLVLFEDGLIPDAVASVTAVTSKRSRSLETPYGNIQWLTVPRSSVFPGTYAVKDPPGYIRATPEKALLDQLYIIRYTPQNYSFWKSFIFEDLRLDEEALEKLDLTNMHELASIYNSPKIMKHIKWFKKYLGIPDK